MAWRAGRVLQSHGGFRAGGSRVGAPRLASPKWQRRQPKCRFCGEKSDFICAHEPLCLRVFPSGTTVRGGGRWVAGPVEVCWATGLSDVAAAELVRCDGVGRRVWAANSSARPGHEGDIHGWGWCYRYQKPFQCVGALAAPVRSLFSAVAETCVGHCARAGFPHFQGLLKSPLEVLGAPGGLVAYLGHKYTPGRCGHPPPAPVAALLGVRPCGEQCSWCAKWGCLTCESCPLHIDSQDLGPTVACFYQRRRCRVGERAWFCVGERAFPLAGGLVVGFSGDAPHGVYATPSAHSSDASPWLGAAFVGCKGSVPDLQ